MHKDRVAEQILRFVLPPDRAEAAAGDWREDAPVRGNVWFWTSLFRLVFASVWRDFSDNPRFITMLALRACLFSWVLSFGFLACLPFILLFAAVAGLFALLFPQFSNLELTLAPILRFPFIHTTLHALNELFALAGAGGLSVLVGRWIARRIPAHGSVTGISACLALPLVNWALPFSVAQILAKSAWIKSLGTPPSFTFGDAFYPVFLEACLLTGFLILRRQSIEKAAQ